MMTRQRERAALHPPKGKPARLICETQYPGMLGNWKLDGGSHPPPVEHTTAASSTGSSVPAALAGGPVTPILGAARAWLFATELELSPLMPALRAELNLLVAHLRKIKTWDGDALLDESEPLV